MKLIIYILANHVNVLLHDACIVAANYVEIQCAAWKYAKIRYLSLHRFFLCSKKFASGVSFVGGVTSGEISVTCHYHAH
jgi:hypothetical protein